MENIEQFLYRFKQNDKLPIRMASPDFGHLSPDVKQKFLPVHRAAHYFFLFMIEGSAKHQLDLQPFEVNNNELLFILPNQIHELPTEKKMRIILRLDLMKVVFPCYPGNILSWLIH